MSMMNAISTVNSVQEIILENFPKLEHGEIIADTSLRSYRSDCQIGMFKLGASTMKGQKLDMELIAAQLNIGEYFGYPPNMRWLAILFVDIEGVVSTVLFKTESLDNFLQLQIATRLKNESLIGKTVRATMSKRSSRANGNSYFAVEFEILNANKKGKFFSAIQDFRQNYYHPGMIQLLESKPPANQSALENK